MSHSEKSRNILTLLSQQTSTTMKDGRAIPSVEIAVAEASVIIEWLTGLPQQSQVLWGSSIPITLKDADRDCLEPLKKSSKLSWSVLPYVGHSPIGSS
jgi:hypothetical protein